MASFAASVRLPVSGGRGVGAAGGGEGVESRPELSVTSQNVKQGGAASLH